MSSTSFDREVIKDCIVALGDEMFEAVIRTSMSPDHLRDHRLRRGRHGCEGQSPGPGKRGHRLSGHTGHGRAGTS